MVKYNIASHCINVYGLPKQARAHVTRIDDCLIIDNDIIEIIRPPVVNIESTYASK